MDTQTIAPGCGPGDNQQSSAAIIPNVSALVAPASVGEEITTALRALAERGLDEFGEKDAIAKLNEQYGKTFGTRLLSEKYKRIKDACWHEKQTAASTPTQEEIEREKLETAQREEAQKVEDLRRQREQAEIDRIVDDLKHQPNLLPVFHYWLFRSGYVCDLRTAASVWISHGARLLSDCTSFTFCGSSASGKSALVNKSAAFLPPDMVVYLTSLSEQAIYYLGNVSGKVMIFGEMAPNVEGQDDYRQRAYRQFISEGKISRGTVEKTDGKTNELAVKETIGPAVAIATTTMEPKQFNDELQNRGGWFWSDDSASTTKAVMDAQAERAAHPVQADDAVLERTIKAFQQYHETLEALPVVVPFAHQIKLDNDHPTARRLFPMLLNYIKASALLHQHVRERRMMEGRAVIVATADDYDVAYDLTTAGAPRVLETNVKPAREAFDAIIKPYMKQGNSIWTAVAMDLLKRPEPTVRRWLEDYAESGLIVCLSRDGRKKVYTLVDDARDHFVQSLGLVAPSQLRQSDWAI